MSEIYIACENLDMIWDSEDVEQFKKLFDKGKSLYELAEHFNRDPDEIAVLIIDYGRRKKR